MENEPNAASKLGLALRTLLFLLVPILFLVFKLRRDPEKAKKLEQFKGPVAFPFVGTMYTIIAMGGPDGKTLS
jgi:hypothetical protein